MWFDNAVWYEFYSLGVTGSPEENAWDWSVWNGAAKPVNRIGKIAGWTDHLSRLGVTAVYFSPVFQSDRHGYDTRDYYTIDSRLGSNEDFEYLCDTLHKRNIRVALDGVFNHTGRGFWAFRDVQQNGKSSAYSDWFHIDFSRNSDRNDGFWYEGWEGCYDLVKLNLDNPQVIEHLFGAVEKWIRLFKIDGLRLDVAYSLPAGFLQKLSAHCNTVYTQVSKTQEPFILAGEIIHGDYNRLLIDAGLSTCTNYELYKGFYSSFNDKNLFEVSYSLNRQFGPGAGGGGLYSGKKLLSFTDNHDVSRLCSILKNKNHLHQVYALLFASPGLPCLYYGSEWGLEGRKEDGDRALRPALHEPVWNDLSQWISQLAFLYKTEKSLFAGNYENLCVRNEQLMFKRSIDNEEAIFCLNISNTDITLHPTEDSYGSFGGIWGSYINLYNGNIHSYNGMVTIGSNSTLLLKKVKNT